MEMSLKQSTDSAYYKAWYKNGGRKRTDRQLLSAKEWRTENPEKEKASRKTRGAIKNGIIQKPPVCSLCKNEGKIIAHHPDYNTPLYIRWLCASCHKLIHIHGESFVLPPTQPLESPLNEINATIESLLLNVGKSWADLAKIIRKNPGILSVRKIKGNWKIDELKKIATALRVKIDDII